MERQNQSTLSTICKVNFLFQLCLEIILKLFIRKKPRCQCAPLHSSQKAHTHLLRSLHSLLSRFPFLSHSFCTSPPFFRPPTFPLLRLQTFQIMTVSSQSSPFSERFLVISKAHSAQTASVPPPTPVPVNCTKSRHSRCHRYLSIALSPFSPSAKIKFAGSRAKQMLPLPWPLVALSQLWVSNNSRTLNSGLLVLPEDYQLNKLKLNEKISCPVILNTVLLLKKYFKKLIFALF